MACIKYRRYFDAMLLTTLRVREGVLARGSGLAWASEVWLFQMGQSNCHNKRSTRSTAFPTGLFGQSAIGAALFRGFLIEHAYSCGVMCSC